MTSHLESPRKILDNGTAIASCACLTNPGIVAFMTARPATIAIVSALGAGEDPIELPRIAAQEIALLSKEFALVRDKEGTVWSVPLSDSTRVREVVRDMQTLCARAAGDGALAISEDGKVFALSLGRGEVGARPADVPGRTRAIHASEGGISLVADGDEGGQLRFYAGTMDRGPSVRVTLPRMAADFDQVRGGRVFSVVYKRGGTSLCVVTRDGTRTEAKMIGLASALGDVAVTDASVVVAMMDGSMAVYDMAVITAADAEFAAPAFTLALGCKGRPRVALAMTIKGATSIWVGTTTGEVLRASLVEGAIPVKASTEEPVVTRPANGEVETLRKELEETRTAEREQLQAALETKTQELQTRTAEREQLQAALETKTQELQTRIAELQTRKDEREQLVSEAVAAEARAAALDKRANELETRVRELDATLTTTMEANGAIRGELDRMKADMLRERQDFEFSRAKRIEEFLPENVAVGLEVLASVLGRTRR